MKTKPRIRDGERRGGLVRPCQRRGVMIELFIKAERERQKMLYAIRICSNDPIASNKVGVGHDSNDVNFVTVLLAGVHGQYDRGLAYGVCLPGRYSDCPALFFCSHSRLAWPDGMRVAIRDLFDLK